MAEITADDLAGFAAGNEQPMMMAEVEPSEEQETPEEDKSEGEMWVDASKKASELIQVAAVATEAAAQAAEMCDECDTETFQASESLADEIRTMAEDAKEVAAVAEETVAQAELEAGDEAGDAGGGVENPTEGIVSAAVAEVDAGELDTELTALMDGYDPEMDGDPPGWVASETLWGKAKAAVDPLGAGSRYSDPWAVVAATYTKMGGGKR